MSPLNLEENTTFICIAQSHFCSSRFLKNFIPSHVDRIFKKQVEHGPAKLYQLHNTESLKHLYIFFRAEAIKGHHFAPGCQRVSVMTV